MAETDELVARLRRTVPGEVRASEPLAPHTTLKVGGPAAAFVVAQTVADLVAVAEACAALDRGWLILGRGSNLLVADEGWPGVVVVLGRGFRGVAVERSEAQRVPGDVRSEAQRVPGFERSEAQRVPGDVRSEAQRVPGFERSEAQRVLTDVGEAVVAGAAEPMPVLATAVARHGLGGLAFGVAIPGSLGGAVRMNAGAMGRELADVLDWAEVVRLADNGRVERLPAAALRLSYRHSALPADAVVTRARLLLARTDPADLAAEMATFKQWRRDHQPVNEPSCGSVFRNPPGDSAGRLIEAAGLKGHRVGGAAVSRKHANFITVESSSRAGDVFQVLRDVREQVARRTGVTLEPEVVLAGFDPLPVPA